MSWNNRVLWTEGMFLQPAHFQQQDRNFQNWVESRCGGMQAYAWGITELEIDRQLLTLGKFAVSRCKGVFPDGTPFDIPDQHPLPVPLELTTDTKNQLVYLALPVKRRSGKEVAWEAEVTDESNRYRLQEIDVKDVHSQADQNDTVIQSGELWTRLRLSSLSQDAFVTVPIARIVEMKTDKHVVLDENFIPSCLHCGAGAPLMDYIEELCGILHHRGEALSQRLGSPGAGGVSEIVDFLLLQIVNRYEPLLLHWSKLKRFHPERLFGVLLQMAGELATITRPEHRFESFPAYQHVDLQKSFDPVMAALREALAWVSESRAIPIPLEEHPHQIRTALIKDRELITSAEFVLAVGAEMSPDKLRSLFPRQTTIATVEKLRDLVMSQVPGIKLNALAVAPRQIPYRKGKTYFELDKNHALWKELQQSGTMAMHFSGEYPGLELEFWAIRR